MIAADVVMNQVMQGNPSSHADDASAIAPGGGGAVAGLNVWFSGFPPRSAHALIGFSVPFDHAFPRMKSWMERAFACDLAQPDMHGAFAEHLDRILPGTLGNTIGTVDSHPEVAFMFAVRDTIRPKTDAALIVTDEKPSFAHDMLFRAARRSVTQPTTELRKRQRAVIQQMGMDTSDPDALASAYTTILLRLFTRTGEITSQQATAMLCKKFSAGPNVSEQWLRRADSYLQSLGNQKALS